MIACQEQKKYLLSAQKDVLSSSGTTKVRFKSLATATMSQIWNPKLANLKKTWRTVKKLAKELVQTADRIWFKPPLQDTLR